VIIFANNYLKPLATESMCYYKAMPRSRAKTCKYKNVLPSSQQFGKKINVVIVQFIKLSCPSFALDASTDPTLSGQVIGAFFLHSANGSEKKYENWKILQLGHH